MSSSPSPLVAHTGAALRRAFIDFFISKGHTAVPSSPLAPNDPTLLFNTAGMVQFKPYYTSAGDVPYTRAVSVQKCLRLTDLDNVGSTPRHCTFFEMLGNFSFGPCSELYFDLGPERPAYLAEGEFWGEQPGDAGDRFMEFWNLVFPQFDAKPGGSLEPLPRPGIDTGMGLERLSMLMQDRRTVFDTDLFQPLVLQVLA